MKRGPQPHKGFDLAMPYAGKRGQVMRFLPCPWYACDFTITGRGCLVFVAIRLAQRSRATVPEIQAEYSEAVKGLRTIPGGGPVSRELWLYSRNGILRFFRVSETGLEEIDRHGDIFVEGKSAIVTQKNPGKEDPLPGGIITAAEAGPGITDPRSPILRWLAKRNAAMKAKAEESAPGNTTGPEQKERTVRKNRAKKKSPAPQVAGIPEVPGVAGPAFSPGEVFSVGESTPSEPGNSRGEI